MYTDLFFQACQTGNLRDVKKYLTQYDADINARDGFALAWACKNDHLEVVKYLLTSPDLKNHADISADNYIAFKLACDYGHVELVKFLVLDHGVPLDNLKDYLEKKTFLLKSDVKDILSLMQEKQMLDMQLNSHLNTTPPSKIRKL